MFPQTQNGPQTGNGFTTPTILSQNNSLLGTPQFQVGAPMLDPGSLNNSTAPQSSTTNPAVASMVKALKG